jgi:hypothetical protein
VKNVKAFKGEKIIDDRSQLLHKCLLFELRKDAKAVA